MGKIFFSKNKKSFLVTKLKNVKDLYEKYSNQIIILNNKIREKDNLFSTIKFIR